MPADFRSTRKEGYGTYIGIIERAGKLLMKNSVLLPKLLMSERDSRYLISVKSNELPMLMSTAFALVFMRLEEFR